MASEVFPDILNDMGIENIMFNAFPDIQRLDNIKSVIKRSEEDMKAVVQALKLDAGFLLYPYGQRLDIMCDNGMVLDQQGRLYVAAGLNQPHPPYETVEPHPAGVYVLTAEGELLDFVAIPRDEVTNCTFGGDDLRTLYITAGGTLWSVRTHAPGQLAWPGE